MIAYYFLYEAFTPFDDDPQEGVKPEITEPPKEEKKPFNWGKFACNVLAGLAVVAATAGLAGPVIGAIAIGGAVSGTAAVASMAVGVTNRFESIVRQKLNGQDIDWGTVALDSEIGGRSIPLWWKSCRQCIIIS